MLHSRIGEIEVWRVEESLGPGARPCFLLPSFDPAVLEEFPELAAPSYYDSASGRLVSSIHSWLLKVGNKVVVVDTGCGNAKTRHPAFGRFAMLDTPWLDRLAACGVAPEDVDVVVNTHLHVDHVGWNTRIVGERWIPTFPRARYLLGRRELAYWHDPEGASKTQPEGIDPIEDSVEPVIAAGLVDLVEADDEILPGISFVAIPGHTVGQHALKVGSGGETGFFTADLFHQPHQVVRPEWSTCFCGRPEEAAATRKDFFARVADSGAVLYPSHVGAPHAGRIERRADGGYRFEPIGMVASN
jgi:glyoxylase-like metal-dependent hydrolase (beta-lactamase superfamily II)